MGRMNERLAFRTRRVLLGTLFNLRGFSSFSALEFECEYVKRKRDALNERLDKIKAEIEKIG